MDKKVKTIESSDVRKLSKMVEMSKKRSPMKSNFGLSEDVVRKLAYELNIILADTHVLYVKTLNYHWNMEDPRFLFLHKMLEKQYTQLAEFADEIAERIRSMGEKAIGTLKQFLELSTVKEAETNLTADQMIANLAETRENAIIHLRKTIRLSDDAGDIGTADLLTDILRDHEKTVWMLRSHL